MLLASLNHSRPATGVQTERSGRVPADCNVILRESKSFVHDLDVQQGIVSSRVALLLRSAEIKPSLSDLFSIWKSAGAGFEIEFLCYLTSG